MAVSIRAAAAAAATRVSHRRCCSWPDRRKTSASNPSYYRRPYRYQSDNHYQHRAPPISVRSIFSAGAATTRWDNLAPERALTCSNHPAQARSFSSDGGAGGNGGGRGSSGAATTSGTPSSSSWLSAAASSSPRDLAALEERILDRIRGDVVDPILERDVVSLGWVRGVSFPRPSPAAMQRADEKDGDDGTTDDLIDPVRVSVRLPTLLHPEIDSIKSQIRDAVRSEISAYASAASASQNDPPSDDERIRVEVAATASKPVPLSRTAAEHAELIKNLGPGLSNVTHFLAVYSCKGGVGKSTVAANLAYELSRMGGRVGLLDVDVYGPSLPVLVRPAASSDSSSLNGSVRDGPAVRRSPLGSGMVYPITHEDVKLMSLGYVNPDSGVPGSGPTGGAAVMRGPMAGRVVSQLLKGTDWGELDVLVLDLPPGTGDVQLQVCQALRLSGAVCVTTPSKLAVTDARKGVEMFTTLGVPTLACVENMAYFDCDGGGRHYPFGRGLGEFKVDAEDDDSHDATPAGEEAATAAAATISETSLLGGVKIVQLPISPFTNGANDDGQPLSLSRPEGADAELSAFAELASTVAEELLLIRHGKPLKGDGSGGGKAMGMNDAMVTFEDEDDGQGGTFDLVSLHMSVRKDGDKSSFLVRLFNEEGAWQAAISGEELRSRDPKSGEKLDGSIDEQRALPKQAGCGGSNEEASGGGMVEHHTHQASSSNGTPRLFPARVEKKGQYGYSVEWADGATIIYSMLSIAKAAGGKVETT